MNFYLKENIFFWTEAFLEQNFKLDLIWYFNWREVDFFCIPIKLIRHSISFNQFKREELRLINFNSILT